MSVLSPWGSEKDSQQSIRCLQPIFTTQLQRKRKVLWAQRATKRSAISNLVREDIITKRGKYNVKLGLSQTVQHSILRFFITFSKYLHYVNISTSLSFFKCSPRVLRTFPLFFNDVQLLQGALCVFKFKVWKFQSKIIHYLPFQNKMKPITQRSELSHTT